MSERVLAQRWSAPADCRTCPYWSAWEGLCFAEDDEMPEECCDDVSDEDIYDDEAPEQLDAEVDSSPFLDREYVAIVKAKKEEEES